MLDHVLECDTESVERIGRAILESRAFQRLRDIRFLGLLSPGPAKRFGCPLCYRTDAPSDGTRADHSIAVAGWAVAFCDRFELPRETMHYAVAWGLLHDIATWPLSHSSEPAFRDLLGLDARDLRRMIVLGSGDLPAGMGVNRILEKMDVSPSALAELFRKDSAHDGPLRPLLQLIRSPLTPDTLEGIWRTGRVFDEKVPSPGEILGAMSCDMLDFEVPESSSPVRNFFEAKAKIYRDKINRLRVVEWESGWSRTIRECLRDIDLEGSMLLREDELIERIACAGIASPDGIYRYKPPGIYPREFVTDRKSPSPKSRKHSNGETGYRNGDSGRTRVIALGDLSNRLRNGHGDGG